MCVPPSGRPQWAILFHPMLNRLLLIFALFLALSPAAKADPIADMLGRILPHNADAKKFVWTITGDGTQQFTIASDGKQVSVSGSDPIAVATGINWYLQHYAGIDISWNSPTATLPRHLPACAPQTHTASVDWRYYLNFCTYSYSMSFWEWERWERELDWMALHGINMPLAITGMECVWREVLMHTYGYTAAEVNTFVCGSAYYGWFFMNNLTAWGGPQPDSWYQQQLALGRRIFRRMTDFGMSPVIPGYVGMIPKDFLTQAEPSSIAGWTASDITNGGLWCSFTRPYFVNNTARLKEFATHYYAAFQRLYGDVCATHLYAIDPFHEGGIPSGVSNAQASVAAMWEALTTFDADAVWVAQHWQDNPTPIVTHTIPHGRLIILDLHGDQYADTECSGHHTTASGTPHHWVWGQVSNFGGNVGLFGRMDRLIQSFYAARNTRSANGLVGIGALPEGIENNPMLYDLLYALPWTTTDYNRHTWLRDYVHIRYGVKPGSHAYNTLLAVWTQLADIYNCPNNNQQGTTESVFLMRPSLTPGTVSSWANSTWYWDTAKLRQALAQMLSVSKAMRHNDNYRYDLVEITRQCLAGRGKEMLEQIKEEKEEAAAKGETGNKAVDIVRAVDEEEVMDKAKTKNQLKGTHAPLLGRRDGGEASFLQLILDQDRLLGTRAELRLGRWTEAARALGNSVTEKNLYEHNARMLLTTWGDRLQCENGGLHDYANREWQGLLSAYYYPRWKAFFQNGCTPQPWFDQFEWPFAQGISPAYGTFTPQPEGDEIATAKELFRKYLQ